MVSPLPTNPMRSKESVGVRLRALREVLGVSAKDLCAAVNVEPNTWSQWENGKRMADLLAMARLCDQTGVDLDYIYLGKFDALPFPLVSDLQKHLIFGDFESQTDDFAVAAGKRTGTNIEHHSLRRTPKKK